MRGIIASDGMNTDVKIKSSNKTCDHMIVSVGLIRGTLSLILLYDFCSLLSALCLFFTGESPIGTIVYYTLVSIPIMLTIFGLIFLFRTHCKIREKCCCLCNGTNMEKKDRNLDYGEYYDAEGDRRPTVMEVVLSSLHQSPITVHT